MLEVKSLTFTHEGQNQICFPDISLSNNEGLIVIGNSGSGKSSLSISFHDCNFITEDVSCIDFSNERPAVIPGLPLVKLSNAIANRFIKEAEKIPLHFDRLGRSYYHVKNHINENIPISFNFNL